MAVGHCEVGVRAISARERVRARPDNEQVVGFIHGNRVLALDCTVEVASMIDGEIIRLKGIGIAVDSDRSDTTAAAESTDRRSRVVVQEVLRSGSSLIICIEIHWVKSGIA